MMRPIDRDQSRILNQVYEFKKECTSQGLRIDDGQAFECLADSDDSYRLARRFHHANLQIDRSCGVVHFSSSEDDFFDLPASNPDDEPEDPEEKLYEIMMMCPILHREKIIRVLLEMKRVGGADTITSSAPAVGIPRSVFYRILAKVRKWVMRPPTPEGWDGNDCSLLVQMDLDLGDAI